jgi:hypothetical protein
MGHGPAPVYERGPPAPDPCGRRRMPRPGRAAPWMIRGDLRASHLRPAPRLDQLLVDRGLAETRRAPRPADGRPGGWFGRRRPDRKAATVESPRPWSGSRRPSYVSRRQAWPALTRSGGPGGSFAWTWGPRRLHGPPAPARRARTRSTLAGVLASPPPIRVVSPERNARACHGALGEPVALVVTSFISLRLSWATPPPGARGRVVARQAAPEAGGRAPGGGRDRVHREVPTPPSTTPRLGSTGIVRRCWARRNREPSSWEAAPGAPEPSTGSWMPRWRPTRRCGGSASPTTPPGGGGRARRATVVRQRGSPLGGGLRDRRLLAALPTSMSCPGRRRDLPAGARGRRGGRAGRRRQPGQDRFSAAEANERRFLAKSRRVRIRTGWLSAARSSPAEAAPAEFIASTTWSARGALAAVHLDVGSGRHLRRSSPTVLRASPTGSTGYLWSGPILTRELTSSSPRRGTLGPLGHREPSRWLAASRGPGARGRRARDPIGVETW